MTKKQNPASASPSWRTVLRVHPAAELFPLLDPEALLEMCDDIRKHGLRESIKLFVEGETVSLIDGRNRLDAMEMAGKPIVKNGEIDRDVVLTEEVQANSNPYDYAVSVNIHRRHLTMEEKRELAAKLVKADPHRSNRAIAKQAKVDHKTVAAVRAEQEGRGEIPHVAKRTDTKGRRQPAAKPSRKATKRKITARQQQALDEVGEGVARALSSVLGGSDPVPESEAALQPVLETSKPEPPPVTIRWNSKQSVDELAKQLFDVLGAAKSDELARSLERLVEPVRQRVALPIQNERGEAS
jgi:hypothetical protein